MSGGCRVTAALGVLSVWQISFDSYDQIELTNGAPIGQALVFHRVETAGEIAEGPSR